jgi:hypothetical protein
MERLSIDTGHLFRALHCLDICGDAAPWSGIALAQWQVWAGPDLGYLCIAHGLRPTAATPGAEIGAAQVIHWRCLLPGQTVRLAFGG